MAIRRNPLLIICLFVILTLTGCAAVDDLNDAWDNRGTYTPPPSQQQTQSQSVVQTNDVAGFNNLPAVKVAILLPLSGPKAALGESMLQAAQLALFDMGYNNFKLIPRDTNGTSAGASSAATSAINDGAQLILGPVFASSVKAVKAVATPNNVNVIAFSTDWTLADRHTFLMGFMPFSQVDRVAQYASQKGYNKFALIAPRDKYGDLVASRFENAARSNGAAITKSIRFMPGDPAVINQIETLKPDGTSNFQAVFMPVGGSQIETISSALSYNKLMPDTTKRLGTGLWDDLRVASQQNMQGAWFAAPSPSARRSFEQKFSKTYGQDPVRLATLAYDATALAAILARNGFQTGSKPAYTYSDLTNPNGFAGADGVFRFQSNGIVERQLAILELRRGQIVEIDPAPSRF